VTSLFGAGRTRLMGFTIIVVTFLVGGLAGAAFDRVLTAESVRRDAPRSEERRGHIIDQVDMEPEQRAAIDVILERRSERMKAAWSEISPRLEAITDSARLEIMAVLTPRQREEYEARLQAWSEERERARQEEESGTDAAPQPAPAPTDPAPAADPGPDQN
jgi:Spy/CpxP family protein refolding chaperone